MSLDEGILRERSPEIPWDRPVLVNVPVKFIGGRRAGELRGYMERYVCRYCIALATQNQMAYITRQEALDHVEREHHD